MLSFAFIFKILRKRMVLGTIFSFALTYFIFSILYTEPKKITFVANSHMKNVINYNDINRNNKDFVKEPAWQIERLKEEVEVEDEMNIIDVITNDTNKENHPCRNSIQGKILIVDEHGIVCTRSNVLPNGCCKSGNNGNTRDENVISTVTKERYSCETCNDNGCCKIYEYCVSCCLHPDKAKTDESTIDAKDKTKSRRIGEYGKIRRHNLIRFQDCLAVCRTSSASVQHENTYKDPEWKHCYTQPQRNKRDLDTNNNADNSAVITFLSVVPLFTPVPNNITQSAI